MDKSKKIMLLANIILAGFFIGVFYHYVLANFFNAQDPYNSFVYPASSAFCDFLDVLPYLKDFAPYHKISLWVVYFPLSYIILYPFYFIKNQAIALITFFSPFLIYFIWMNIKVFVSDKLSKIQNFQNIFIITVLSYPFLYLMDKANFDMYLFVLMGLSIYAFKTRRFMASSILLAVANAIKPFAIFFLILFLKEKKYKEFFISIILSSILVIGGFLTLKGGFLKEIYYLILSLRLFKVAYVHTNYETYGMAFGSSLYMLLKLIFCKLTTNPIISTYLLSRIYNIFSLIVTAITLVFVWRESLLWKQITLLTCHFLLLPCITYDYKLIFLFIPLWLFVNQKEKMKYDLAYTLLFAMLLIPKSFIFINTSIHSPTVYRWIFLSIILNPIILIALMVLIAYEQIKNRGASENISEEKS